VNIRSATESDLEKWAILRNCLWPDSIENHSKILAKFISGDGVEVVEALVIETADEGVLGFIELNLRNYAEGSKESQVPYIEGWYVSEPYQQMGYGKQLIQAAEEWAINGGYRELASDTELTNENSIQIHKHLGFKETERLVCFIKQL